MSIGVLAHPPVACVSGGHPRTPGRDLRGPGGIPWTRCVETPFPEGRHKGQKIRVARNCRMPQDAVTEAHRMFEGAASGGGPRSGRRTGTTGDQRGRTAVRPYTWQGTLSRLAKSSVRVSGDGVFGRATAIRSRAPDDARPHCRGLVSPPDGRTRPAPGLRTRIRDPRTAS